MQAADCLFLLAGSANWQLGLTANACREEVAKWRGKEEVTVGVGGDGSVWCKRVALKDFVKGCCKDGVFLMTSLDPTSSRGRAERGVGMRNGVGGIISIVSCEMGLLRRR